MVCLLDMEYERTIRRRNTNSRIPAGMQRNFICNEHEHLSGDYAGTGGHESVTGRYKLIDVKNGDLVEDQEARRH